MSILQLCLKSQNHPIIFIKASSKKVFEQLFIAQLLALKGNISTKRAANGHKICRENALLESLRSFYCIQNLRRQCLERQIYSLVAGGHSQSTFSSPHLQENLCSGCFQSFHVTFEYIFVIFAFERTLPQNSGQIRLCPERVETSRRHLSSFFYVFFLFPQKTTQIGLELACGARNGP